MLKSEETQGCLREGKDTKVSGFATATKVLPFHPLSSIWPTILPKPPWSSLDSAHTDLPAQAGLLWIATVHEGMQIICTGTPVPVFLHCTLAQHSFHDNCSRNYCGGLHDPPPQVPDKTGLSVVSLGQSLFSTSCNVNVQKNIRSVIQNLTEFPCKVLSLEYLAQES